MINWTAEEIRNLDRKTKKPLTKKRTHHPKSDVDRMYLPRLSGGRGLIQIETTYKTTTIGLATYLEKSDDSFLKLVNRYTTKSSIRPLPAKHQQDFVN